MRCGRKESAGNGPEVRLRLLATETGTEGHPGEAVTSTRQRLQQAAGNAWGGLSLGSRALPCVCTENVNTNKCKRPQSHVSEGREDR